MTDEPLPPAAQPDSLTQALRHCGALGDGRVASVDVVSSRPTILSRIIRLRLTYDGAAAAAPPSLILKLAHPERKSGGWSGGRQEVAFYHQVAAATSVRAVPRCFEARWDEATGDWHLLLEDLTDSHATATTWPLPPTVPQCERIIRARARFHAAWWDDPRLGVSIGSWGDDGVLQAHLQRFESALGAFVDRMGDRFPRERRELFERLIAAGLRLNARVNSRRNLTILHGDSHVWNCFLPNEETSDDVLLFDWDSWRIDVATDDLAYMMAMHWYPDLRRRRERALLDCYHAELLRQGVRGYDRRAIDDDYRLSVLWHITTPVWQASINIPPVVWWNNLERILLAVDDLGCRKLLA
jgi:hypothetical protein